MSSGSGRQPEAPDYAAAAAEQSRGQMGLTNFATQLGRPNEFNQLGARQWTVDDQGNYSSYTSMSPEQEALYWQSVGRQADQGAGAASRLDQINAQGEFNPTLPSLRSEIPTQGLPSLQGYNTQGLPSLTQDFSADRRRVEDAVMSRQNEDIDRQQAALETQLANQGITRGSEAFDREMDMVSRRRTDATNQAILAGGQEQSRLAGLTSQTRGQLFGEQGAAAGLASQQRGQLFGEGAQGAQFGNQARQQAMAEAITRRQLPMQEYQALSGGTAPTLPSFQNFGTAGLATPGESPALQQYADDVGRYNAGQARRDAQNQQYAQLGTAALMYMMSDPRLKTNIEHIGVTEGGVNWYRWDWIDGSGSSEGVMATEVPAEWTAFSDDGYLMVDYSKVH